MNTTQVPTEWFREIIEINNKIIEASTPPTNEKDWSFYIGCLQSHIYNYKYFQPQPDSVDLEEFLRWYFDDDCNYVYHELAKYFETIDLKKQVPFSEVYEAFQKSKG
jgi:hypothetical protein